MITTWQHCMSWHSFYVLEEWTWVTYISNVLSIKTILFDILDFWCQLVVIRFVKTLSKRRVFVLFMKISACWLLHRLIKFNKICWEKRPAKPRPNLRTSFCRRDLKNTKPHLNAGRRTDFWDEKSSDFSGEIFRERNFGEALLVYNFVPIIWLWSGFIYPRIRSFVEKLFHGLFSKKKRAKSGGAPSFPRREHVLAVISLPSGQPTALDLYHEIPWLLKIERHFLPEKAVLGQKFLSRKISPEKSLNFLSQKSVLRPA